MTANQQILAALPMLRRRAVALTRNRDTADDLVNDTVVQILRKYHLFQQGTNFGAWAGTVLFNIFRSQRRGAHRTVTCDPEILRDLVHQEPNQDFNVFQNETLTNVTKLPKRQRDVVVHVAVLGFGQDEAAKILGIKTATVRTRLFRAREVLSTAAER